MDSCTNHPDHAAIERCEVCGDPLCDLCLWYADDGRRLCERHANDYTQQGGEAQPPSFYGQAIRVKEVSHEAPAAPYQGNENDLRAAAAGLIGATALATTFGGLYCLPLVALVLGLIGLSNASKALDPERTRRLSVLGIALSGLSFLPFLFFICIFFFGVAAAIAGAAAGGP